MWQRTQVSIRSYCAPKWCSNYVEVEGTNCGCCLINWGWNLCSIHRNPRLLVPQLHRIRTWYFRFSNTFHPPNRQPSCHHICWWPQPSFKTQAYRYSPVLGKTNVRPWYYDSMLCAISRQQGWSTDQCPQPANAYASHLTYDALEWCSTQGGVSTYIEQLCNINHSIRLWFNHHCKKWQAIWKSTSSQGPEHTIRFTTIQPPTRLEVQWIFSKL